MRVIAGTARGRRLRTPTGSRIRPTSDRVREAMFSSLGDAVAGARVLDLFAGTGAVGIEALSRGAAAVVFVDADRTAAALVRENLTATGTADRATVVAETAERFCAAPRGGPFDIVVCDPPYDQTTPWILGLLSDLATADALAPQARVVVERQRRDPGIDGEVTVPDLLVEDRRRSYGDTVLVHLRRESLPP